MFYHEKLLQLFSAGLAVTNLNMRTGAVPQVLARL